MSSSSGWLSDTTANKIKHSYINGFLDVSGETITRGANTVYQSVDYDWNAYGQVISGNYESDNEVYFGTSIGMDVSGLTFVAGAHFQDGANTSNTNDGAATVYRYDTTAEIWYQLGNTITGETNNSAFGINADMNDAGTRIMVVDPVANFVNVYDYNASTNNWDKQVSITAHELQQFMGRISGDGNTIVFGNYTDNSNRGKQYVYRNTSGTTWTKIGEFTGAHTNAYAGIAASITYDGNRITFPEIDYNFDADGNSSADNGRVTIYDYSGSGTSWNQVGDPIYGTFTGAKLAASMDFSKDGSIIAFSSNVNHHVKVYQYDVSVDGSWKQLGTTIRGSAQQFGYSIRLSDDGTVLVVADMFDSTVGDDYGALYIHKYTNGDWVKQGSTLYGLYTGGGQYPGGSLGGDYGRGIEISGDGTKIIAGGYSADVNGTDSGYIKAWQWSQKTFTKPMMNISNQTMTVWGGGEHKLSSYSVSQFASDIEELGIQPSKHLSFSSDGSTLYIGTQLGYNSANEQTGTFLVVKYANGMWSTLGSTIAPSASEIGTYTGTLGRTFLIAGNISSDGTRAMGNWFNQDTDINTERKGLIRVYHLSYGKWEQLGNDIEGDSPGDMIRDGIMSGDGNTVIYRHTDYAYVKTRTYNSNTNTWDLQNTFSGGRMYLKALSYDGTVRVDFDRTTTGDYKIITYKYSNGSWTQIGQAIKSYEVARNKEMNLAKLSKYGDYLLIGDQDSFSGAGVAIVYKYSSEGDIWMQVGGNIQNPFSDGFSFVTAGGISEDGKTIVVTDNTTSSLSGAYAVYKNLDDKWTQIELFQNNNTSEQLGLGGTMCDNGEVFAVSSGRSSGTEDRFVRVLNIANNPALTIGSGNVGIGTDTAIPKLDVNGATFLRNQTLTFESDGGGGAATEEVALVFNQASNNRTLALKTDYDGNLYGTTGSGGGRSLKWLLGSQTSNYFAYGVGIGTDNPGAAQLTLSKNTNTAAQLELRVTGGILDGQFTGIKFTQDPNGSTELSNIRCNYANDGQPSLSFGVRNVDTAMLINKNGNVGIGTNSPEAKLELKTATNYDGYFLKNNSNTLIGKMAKASGHGGYMSLYNSDGASKITFNSQGNSYINNGNVGIRTTSPNHPLHVAGSGGSLNANLYAYHHYQGSWQHHGGNKWDTGSNGIGLRVEQGIICARQYIMSDERIKTNIVDLVDDEALVKFRQLKPKTYSYVDTNERGEQSVYGFIAQEVAEIIPNSCTTITEYIPNIMSTAKISEIDMSFCVLTMTTEHQLMENDIISARDASDNVIDNISVIEIIDSKTIKIDKVFTQDETTFVDETGYKEEDIIFVYGKRVDDFHNLNKDSVWTVSTAALQEVDRQQQADKAKIAALETDNATLKTQITDILARLSALESG